MAKAHRLKRMHLVYDKHAHTCCHYLQLEWYCTKARTRTLLTAHWWRNSIWVRMQTGGGMGARYGETGRALICQAAVHQWSVNGTHKPWGLGPDTLHPLLGCRHSPGPRHGGGLRAKATGRVNDAWPVGHAHTHTHLLGVLTAVRRSLRWEDPVRDTADVDCAEFRGFAAMSQVLLAERDLWECKKGSKREQEV